MLVVHVISLCWLCGGASAHSMAHSLACGPETALVDASPYSKARWACLTTDVMLCPAVRWD